MLVSIIVPVYNGAEYLAEAVDSLLGQTYRDIEVIAVDDGSTDATPDVLASYSDPRLRVLRQDNAGTAAAQATGFAAAQGEVLTVHGADDLSLPHRFAVLLRQLAASDADYAHSDMLLIDSAGGPLQYWQAAPLRDERILPFLLAVGTPFNNGSLIFGRHVLEAAPPDRSLAVGEDTDMVRQFAPLSRGAYVPEPLYLYRRHQSSLTSGGGAHLELPGIRKLLTSHERFALVPAAARSLPDAVAAGAVAAALIGLSLLRRGQIDEAQSWLDVSITEAAEGIALPLVAAIIGLAVGDPALVIERLQGVGGAIAHNLRGEALAQLGQGQAAVREFLAALHLDPDYSEPVVNLKALGAAAGGLHLVDTTWRRYL